MNKFYFITCILIIVDMHSAVVSLITIDNKEIISIIYG